MECFSIDLANAIDALEYYITTVENDLIDRQAGDIEWDRLRPYKATLENIKYMMSIYG